MGLEAASSVLSEYQVRALKVVPSLHSIFLQPFQSRQPMLITGTDKRWILFTVECYHGALNTEIKPEKCNSKSCWQNKYNQNAWKGKKWKRNRISYVNWLSVAESQTCRLRLTICTPVPSAFLDGAGRKMFSEKQTGLGVFFLRKKMKTGKESLQKLEKTED